MGTHRVCTAYALHALGMRIARRVAHAHLTRVAHTRTSHAHTSPMCQAAETRLEPGTRRAVVAAKPKRSVAPIGAPSRAPLDLPRTAAPHRWSEEVRPTALPTYPPPPPRRPATLHLATLPPCHPATLRSAAGGLLYRHHGRTLTLTLTLTKEQDTGDDDPRPNPDPDPDPNPNQGARHQR